MNTVPLSSPSIDLGRVDSLCYEEWRSFLAGLDQSPIPESQDLRGFFLNWVTLFMPEAFPPPLRSEMVAWMQRHQESDQSIWGWTKGPAIGATLFALTDDPHWLHIQRSNFDYGGADLRSFLHKTLALIAPRVTFDVEFLERLDRGMRVPYFYMDTPLVLYAVSKGDPTEKVATLKKWSESCLMNAVEEETVSRLLKGESANNPLQSYLLRNTSYVALRMGCYPGELSSGTILPLGLALSDVWKRMEDHALFSAYVKLDRMAERNSNG